MFFSEDVLNERELIHNGPIDNDGRPLRQEDSMVSAPFTDSATDKKFRSLLALRNSVKQSKTTYLPISETHHLSSYLEVLTPECKEKMRYYEELIATRNVPNVSSGFFAQSIPKSTLDTEADADGQPVSIDSNGVKTPIAPQALALLNFAALCGLSANDAEAATYQMSNLYLNVGRETQHLANCVDTSEELGRKITACVTEFEDGHALGDKLVGLTISPFDFLPQSL